MSSAIRSLRFLPGGDSLDRQRYKDGEVFWDGVAKTIRVYDGNVKGGFRLATEGYVDTAVANIPVLSTALSIPMKGYRAQGEQTINYSQTTSVFFNELVDQISLVYTNVPEEAYTVRTATVVIGQSDTPFIPQFITVNGVGPMSMLWQNSSRPTGTVYGTDVVTISLVKYSPSSWQIWAKVDSYGVDITP